MPHPAPHHHRNWFDQGGAAYARFRPEYPPELARWLAAQAPHHGHALAVDVGCGNGQLTAQLAEHFQRVLGLDPSREQLAHAAAHPRVAYACAPAEALPVPTGSASLIAAAQAAHWFDLPRFYAEARRIGQSGAVLALIGYGVLRLDDDALHARFQHFYTQEIGPYWPAERKLVDSGYADLPFPFAEQAAPALDIRKQWDLPALLGYIATWSAVRQAREAGREDLLQNFATDLAELWGAPACRRAIVWPIHLRWSIL
ncbi:Uncharacterised protein [uncultured Comamonas sp.]|nr:Uncharacterised protein [uncultured Comamonas sp.]